MREPEFLAYRNTVFNNAYQYGGHSLWRWQGLKGAPTTSSTINGATLGASNSPIPFADPDSGKECRLANFCMTGPATDGGNFILYDRLWHNGNISCTSTSAQTMTTPTWPARDDNGETDGEGVGIALEVASSTGSGTPTITISYTNSAGTSGRTGTCMMPGANSQPTGRYAPFYLQSGDIGVRSVESITLSSSWSSGTLALFAYREIASLPFNAGYSSTHKSLLDNLGAKRLWDDSCLFPAFTWSSGGGNVDSIYGLIQFTHVST